jgi:hypothetical protein
MLVLFYGVTTAVRNADATVPLENARYANRIMLPEVVFASERDIITVAITIKPAADVKAYAIEESIPEGCEVSLIGDQGGFDSVNMKVKFGPYIDNIERTLIYHLSPPEKGGEYNIDGAVSFDGNPAVKISGTEKFTVIEGTKLEGVYIDEMRFRNKLREIGEGFWELSDMIGNPRQRD